MLVLLFSMSGCLKSRSLFNLRIFSVGFFWGEEEYFSQFCYYFFFLRNLGTELNLPFCFVSFLFSYNVSNNIYIESHMHFINN